MASAPLAKPAVREMPVIVATDCITFPARYIRALASAQRPAPCVLARIFINEAAKCREYAAVAKIVTRTRESIFRHCHLRRRSAS